MDKKILVVGAGTSQVNAIQRTIELGHKVYAIDGDMNAPGFTFSTEYRVEDIRDSKKLIQAAIDFDVDGITSFSTDVPIVSIAEAASKMNLPGISINQAKLSVNKYLQRNMLVEFGIQAPFFRIFHTKEDGLNALQECGHPAVIKPIDSSGSRGVRFSSNDIHINKAYCLEALKLSPSNSGIIESFIAGPEIAVDGFAIHGTPRILSVCDKRRTDPPYLLDEELLFPSQISEPMLKKVTLLTAKIIQASKIKNSPFHIEMILTKDGPILVEFGARGAGFNVYDSILPFVSGVDTIEIQLKQCFGEQVSLDNIDTKAAYLFFLSSQQNGVLRKISGQEEISAMKEIANFKMFKKEGDSVNQLTSGSDRIGYILALTDSPKAAREAINKAKKILELQII
jgi:biotin carboxylase